MIIAPPPGDKQKNVETPFNNMCLWMNLENFKN